MAIDSKFHFLNHFNNNQTNSKICTFKKQKRRFLKKEAQVSKQTIEETRYLLLYAKIADLTTKGG
jgi:hypothetical protein